MRLFDLHCDTLYECVKNNLQFRDNTLAISLNNGVNSGIESWIQCFAIWMPDELRGDAARNFYIRARNYFINQIEKNSDLVDFVKSGSELKSSIKKVRAILTVEGGSAAAGSLENIRSMHEDGVKVMTLTWNGANELGSGQLDNRGGLTVFGRDAVKLMNRLGIIVDVSHLNDRGFYDVCRISEKPFIATHSNLRSVCPYKRNLTDEQFKEIVSRGGIVGINFYREFISEKDSDNIDMLFRHIERFLELGGENALCIGSDFDGADMPKYIKDITCVENLYDNFLKKGYAKELCNKIFYKNAESFFNNNLT